MTAPPAGWPAGPLYVVEPASSGHRLWYVRLLADAAAGSCTLLTTPPVPASVEFELHLAGADLRTETVTPAGDRGRGWYRAALARAAAVPGSSVVMPDAEAALLPLLGARAGGVRAITVVLMRTTRGPGLRGLAVFVAKLLLVAALRLRWRSRLRAFALLPPGSELRPLHRLAGLRAVHDPVRFAPAEYDPAAARDRLGLPTQGQVFAVIGPLSDRKSVPEIIDAWRSARRPGVLLLAGTAPPTVAAAAAEAGPAAPIVLRDGYLSDEDFDTYLVATDVALLLYRNRGSSGVLAKAVAADCDVLTSTTTPAVRPGRGLRLQRLDSLTAAEIGRAVSRWPARRERRPERTDRSADFARVLLGTAP